MKLFFLIVAVGLVALVFADLSEDIVPRGKSSSNPKYISRKGKSAKSSCPSPTAYVPPNNCDSSCYSDMGAMIDDISLSIADETSFAGTVCSGTHHYPTNKYMNGFKDVSEVTLGCCGRKNSCIVDGGGPDQRRVPLFYFKGMVKNLVLEGIHFQNINCYIEGEEQDDCSGGILHVKGVAVITLRHLIVNSVATNQIGGVFFLKGGDITIEDCSFTNNHAYFGAGVISADASMMLNGNSFYGNSANNGGAIETIRSFVAICNTFENNKAGLGGAISSVAGDLRLLYNKFLGNTANSGGAISSYRQTMFSMENKYTKTSVNDTFVNGGFEVQSM